MAFTFVNLSVIAQFWIREKRNKTLKDHLNYLVLPIMGALTVGALWINLEETSMVLGRCGRRLVLFTGVCDPHVPQSGTAV